MTNEVKLLPCGVENFLSAIMAKTPNGEWITVQYHPNGDWSVAAEVASTNDDLAWLKGEVEHCRRMEYVTEAERYERIYNALLATRPTIVTDEVVERMRDLSFALAAGGSEETDPAKLLDRIVWGVNHIQQVEAQRAADLIEELSKTPRTTWGEVKKAVLSRAFADPANSAIAAMPAIDQNGGDHALPPSGLSQSSSSQAKPPAAIARKET